MAKTMETGSLIERLERYKRCCTVASEAYQLLTEAITALKGEEGPGEEDGPWAEGWETRRGVL